MDGYDNNGGMQPRGMQPSTTGDQASSIFVSNLQWWTTDEELESLCTQYGKVSGIRFIEDRSCGKSRGMAVVEFAEPTSVQPCIDGLNGRDINGRPCKVSKQMQRPMPGGPGMQPHPGRGGMPGRGGPPMGGRSGGRGRGGGMDQMDPSMMGMWGMMPPGMMMGGPPMGGMMPPPGMPQPQGGFQGGRPPPPPGP